MSVEFLDDHCMLESQKLMASDPEGHVVFAFDFVYLPIGFWVCSDTLLPPGGVWKPLLSKHETRRLPFSLAVSKGKVVSFGLECR